MHTCARCRHLAAATTNNNNNNNNNNNRRDTKATLFSTTVFENNIRDRARLALSIIIGNNPFTETFLSTSAVARDKDGDGMVDESDSFKGIIHDAFMKKFSQEMMSLWWVGIRQSAAGDDVFAVCDLRLKTPFQGRLWQPCDIWL